MASWGFFFHFFGRRSPFQTHKEPTGLHMFLFYQSSLQLPIPSNHKRICCPLTAAHCHHPSPEASPIIYKAIARILLTKAYPVQTNRPLGHIQQHSYPKRFNVFQGHCIRPHLFCLPDIPQDIRIQAQATSCSCRTWLADAILILCILLIFSIKMRIHPAFFKNDGLLPSCPMNS